MLENLNFKFYFGDNKNSFERDSLDDFKSQQENFNLPIIKELRNNWNAKYFITLKQIHNNIGHIITKDNLDSFLYNLQIGDYIITNIKNIALGVYTADCLAIIFYDTENNVIGICHAGWAGSIKKIVKKIFTSMKTNFNTQAKNTHVIFSPSAKSCCYSVTEEFKQNLNNYNKANLVLTKKNNNLYNNNLYFDLPLFNLLELIELKIPKSNINLDFNKCTICNINFCSYRRDKMNSKRQISLVSLIKN